MLGKLLTPFTTATATGVAMRDIAMTIGSILAVLGVLGFLTPDQVKELTDQAPTLLTAVGTVITLGVSVYRVITKSSSDKAAEVAKQVDAKVPKTQDVVIKTPPNKPDIVVSAK